MIFNCQEFEVLLSTDPLEMDIKVIEKLKLHIIIQPVMSLIFYHGFVR